MADGFHLATAYLRVEADTSGLNRQVNNGLGGVHGQTTRAGSDASAGFRKKFLGGLKGLGGAAVGVMGVASLGSFIKDSVQGWEEHLTVVRQTNAVIKSTGGAAMLTTKQFGDLADSIEAATGIDGDEILKGENILATFTAIKGKVFKEATKTAVDLSSAFGMPLKNANVMLGKALQDPLKGISALSKVGVTFSAQQKKQIETFVKTGQLAKAQGVILTGVNGQVEGSAKAQETMGQKMAVVWHQIQDTVGKALMPIISKLANFVTTTLLPGFQVFASWAAKHVVPVLKDLGQWIAAHVVPALRDMGQWIMTHIVPALIGFGQWFKKNLPSIKAIIATWWNYVKQVFNSFGQIVMTVWNTALKPLVGWIKAHWSEISTAIKIAFTVAGTTIRVFANIINWLLRNIIVPVFKAIIAVIRTTFNVVAAVIKAGIATYRAFAAATKWLNSAVRTAWNAIKNAIRSAINAVRNAISSALSGIKSAWSSVWNTLKTIVGGVWSGIKTAVFTGINAVSSVISRVGRTISTAWSRIWNGLKKTVTGVVAGIGNVVQGIWSGVTSGLKGVVNGGIDIINGAISGINHLIDVANEVPFVDIPHISQIPHLASGGWVSGPGTSTSDSIRAMLSKGEFVVNARSAARNKSLLEHINGGPGGAVNGGYAKGGSVGGRAGSIATFLAQTFGLTRAQIAGFLGNFKVESGFNPRAFNPREGAIGLAQWEGSRRTALQNYANKRGLKETDLKAQLGYLAKELRGSSVLRQVKEMSNPAQIAALIDAQFERSSGEARGARMSAATQLFSQLGNGVGGVGSMVTGSGKKKGLAGQAKLLVNIESKDALAVIKNLFGPVKTLAKATRTLLQDVRSAVAGGTGKKGLVDALERQTTRLIQVAKKRADVVKKLAASKADLAKVRAAWHEMHDSIKQAVTGTFDISSAGSDGGVGSMDRLLASLKQAVGDGKSFAAELKRLKKLGLNKTLLNQLAQAGPGSANAQALAGATKAQISQVNSLTGQLASYGNSAGTTVADAFYRKRINQDVKAVHTNSRKLTSLNTTMLHLDSNIQKLTHSGAMKVKKTENHYHVGNVTIDAKSVQDIQDAAKFFHDLQRQAKAKGKR